MNKPFQNILIGLFLVLFAGFPVLSCGNEVEEGTLIYARGTDSEQLDPHQIDDGESVKVVEQIYDPLLQFSENLEEGLQPALATDWASNETGDVWTFQLREGVEFHDGTPFTAEAVKLNMQRLRNSNGRFDDVTAPMRGEYQNINEVEVIDETTVRFHLEEPSGVFLRNMAMYPARIISPASIQAEQEGEEFQISGTGPFAFEAWNRGESIHLVRNEQYYGEPAASERVVFIPVRENSTRVQQLINGGVHIADNPGVLHIEEIRQSEQTDLLEAPGMNFGYFAMNTERPPFDQKNVRKAIAYAIDQERILEEVYQGVGERASSPLPPRLWGHHDDLQSYERDLEQARELLQRENVNLDSEINFLHMSNPRPYMPQPDEVARIIASNLEELGFTNISLETQDWQNYQASVNQGDHDLCILGWTIVNADPDYLMNPLFHSSNTKKGSATNISFFRNDEVDRLVERARRTIDQEERAEMYRDAQEIINDSVPILPLVYMPVQAGKRKEVKGFDVNSIGEVRLKEAHRQQEP